MRPLLLLCAPARTMLRQPTRRSCCGVRPAWAERAAVDKQGAEAMCLSAGVPSARPSACRASNRQRTAPVKVSQQQCNTSAIRITSANAVREELEQKRRGSLAALSETDNSRSCPKKKQKYRRRPASSRRRRFHCRPAIGDDQQRVEVVVYGAADDVAAAGVAAAGLAAAAVAAAAHAAAAADGAAAGSCSAAAGGVRSSTARRAKRCGGLLQAPPT